MVVTDGSNCDFLTTCSLQHGHRRRSSDVSVTSTRLHGARSQMLILYKEIVYCKKGQLQTVFLT
jgi:hypothetical protein